METKRTPGKWEFTVEVTNNGGWKSPEQMVCIYAGPTIIADYSTSACEYGDDDENVANAQLMASAPDLLEALQAVCDDYKRLADSGDAGFWDFEELPVAKQARAAIAKALGEQA